MSAGSRPRRTGRRAAACLALAALVVAPIAVGPNAKAVSSWLLTANNLGEILLATALLGCSVSE